MRFLLLAALLAGAATMYSRVCSAGVPRGAIGTLREAMVRKQEDGIRLLVPVHVRDDRRQPIEKATSRTE